jgi:DNA repair protein RecO (recombination protein O)
MSQKEIIENEVICLSRREFSETSLVLVMLSRDHGKISLLAKGVKRPRGKTAGGIDLLDAGEASFILNREGLSILREFAPGKPFPAIRNNIHKWYAALYLAEVVNMTTQDLEPVSEIFRLLSAAIERVSTAEDNQILAKILIRALKRLLVLIGYRPELESCVICRRKLTPADQLYFSASSGGVVCRNCEPGVVEKMRLEHRTWYYLLNRMNDLQSASAAFDILNYMLRETLGKTPTLRSYCQSIFSFK